MYTCKIWSALSAIAADSSLLRCDAASNGKLLLTLRRTIVSSSARSHSPTRIPVGLLDAGMNMIRSIQKSVTLYPSKNRDIPADTGLLIRESVF